MSDFFNPPADPVDGTPYTFGNITWRYDATSGVWNIVDASLVGERGPQGDIGPTGNTGNTGATGDPSAGDGGALTVSNGFITSRLGGFGVTGVVGVTGRFGVQGGIISLMPASTGESGIASFDSEFFNVTSTGHVSLRGDINIGGDTVVAGVAIGTSAAGDNLVVNNLGVTSFNGLTGAITTTLRAGGGITITGTNFTDQTIINRGVTSFNGLTGAVNGLVTINGINPTIPHNFTISVVGDQRATIAQQNAVGSDDQTILITARLATTGATGVASFNNNFFSVQNGAVSLTGPYAVVGVTGIGFGNDVGLTGKINLTAADASMTITRDGNTIRFASNAVGGGGGGITAIAQQIVFADGSGGGTGSSNFVFNGTSATFGGANTQFTITGPTFNIGNNTVVRGGVFFDAAESAPFKDNGVANVIVRANEGSVQRFTVSPIINYTVGLPTLDDGWTDQLAVAESVVVILQSTNGKTGQFASDILTPSSDIAIGGVTGGVDVFTLMRIKHPSGAIKMAFPIARAMTGSNIRIN